PKKRLENAQKLGETSLMFLVHPTLSQDSIEKTILAINAVNRALQS
ncbi:aminotransferase, partial [Acinetobacter baumannii]